MDNRSKLKSGFLSRASIYHGDYNCIMRNPDCEFEADTHYHDFYEVQFYLSGNGKILLGDKKYTLGQGDVVLVNIFQPHRLLYTNKVFYERFCIDLDPSFLLAACTDNSNLLELFNEESPNFPIYHMTMEQLSNYLNMFIKYENISLENGRDILERSILYEILANLYNDLCKNGLHTKTDKHSISIIAELVRYINDHLGEDLSLELLAAQVSYSTFHLCRTFKKYTGYTLTKYITSKRIEYVKNLMRNGLSISDACLKAGFNNYSYFYKTFKSLVGVNPQDYQMQIQDKTKEDKNAKSVNDFADMKSLHPEEISELVRGKGGRSN